MEGLDGGRLKEERESKENGEEEWGKTQTRLIKPQSNVHAQDVNLEEGKTFMLGFEHVHVCMASSAFMSG